MIIGIGIDLIELDRIEKSLQKKDALMRRILTKKEQEVFRQFRSQKRQVEFLAGRFAAKEAFAKATGHGIGKLSFQDIEVLAHENGAPVMKAIGYEKHTIHVSITHSRDYAAAQVLLEKK